MLGVVVLTACSGNSGTTVTSPSGNIEISFKLNDQGAPVYAIQAMGKTVIDTSSMGFDFRDQPSMAEGFQITGSTLQSFEETWTMPWGEQREVENNYNELVVHLKETEAPNRKLDIYFALSQ